MTDARVRRNLPRGAKRYSPAIAGLMAGLALLAREPMLICLRRLLGKPRRSPAERAAQLLSLHSLRAAVIGRQRESIFRMFGPPLAVCDGKRTVWYYPITVRDRIAMAISFQEERAELVEFFHPPAA